MGGVAPLSAALSSNLASGSDAGSPVVTGSVTVTPSGGTGPYTYDWEYVSGDASITVDSDASATTTWRRNMAPLESFSANWRCKVTDALARVVYTGDVTVSVERF